MDLIFHEKQTGMLCAQHALNVLLQNQYFSPVDLAEIAKSLEEVERQNMIFHGIDPSIRGKDSQHFDDSGYFSFEVIAKALQPFDLSLIPFESTDPIAESARIEPTAQRAYICNYKLHWFTIRKLGFQWFNLNSTLARPVLVSDTYLSLFLEQLRSDRYHVFIVVGDLPPCEADNYLHEHPVEATAENMGSKHGGRRRGLSREQGDGVSSSSSGGSDELRTKASADPELQNALAESKRLTEEDDHTLQRVLDQSRRDAGISDDEWHASRAAAQNRLDDPKLNSDEDELMRAIAMSLDGQSDGQSALPNASSSVSDPHPPPGPAATTADSATVRSQREQFLKKFETTPKNN